MWETVGGLSEMEGNSNLYETSRLGVKAYFSFCIHQLVNLLSNVDVNEEKLGGKKTNKR